MMTKIQSKVYEDWVWEIRDDTINFYQETELPDDEDFDKDFPSDKQSELINKAVNERVSEHFTYSYSIR